MASVFEYLQWRGDISFSEDSFNIIDSLILSQISYLPFDNIVLPAGNKKNAPAITIEAAAAQFAEKYKSCSPSFLGAVLPPDLIPLFQAAAKTKRFADIPMFNFISSIDYETQKQFAAISFALPFKKHADSQLSVPAVYVAFRGTDDTLVGWKEDFNMSFITPIPAQTAAVAYIENTAGISRVAGYGKIKNCPLYSGGHSKGGNLAIYAAAFCSEPARKRICAIHNFDGPGFSEEIISGDPYRSIQDRITTVLPKLSIIGMLFSSTAQPLIVESTESGIMQHSALSWQVYGTSFIQAAPDRTGVMINQMIRDFINSLSKERREIFIGTLFEILEASGAKTVSDMTADKKKTAAAVFTAVRNLTEKEREIMNFVFKTLWNSGTRNLKDLLR